MLQLHIKENEIDFSLSGYASSHPVVPYAFLFIFLYAGTFATTSARALVAQYAVQVCLYIYMQHLQHMWYVCNA